VGQLIMWLHWSLGGGTKTTRCCISSTCSYIVKRFDPFVATWIDPLIETIAPTWSSTIPKTISFVAIWISYSTTTSSKVYSIASMVNGAWDCLNLLQGDICTPHTHTWS
jgi:hypothetical protein